MSWILAWVLSRCAIKWKELRDSPADFSQRLHGIRQGISTKWKRSGSSDSAYDSDFRFSLGHKLSYDSDYDSDSDSVASENQPLAFNFEFNRIYNKILDRDWFSARLFVA